jgi:hypothetical protein
VILNKVKTLKIFYLHFEGEQMNEIRVIRRENTDLHCETCDRVDKVNIIYNIIVPGVIIYLCHSCAVELRKRLREEMR